LPSTFLSIGFTHHLGVAFYRVCSPRRTGGAEKRPKDSFGLFLWPVSVSAPFAGSRLCSVETLLGPVAWTTLCVGICYTGQRFPKAAVFAGRGLLGPMQPSEVFQSVPPRREWAGIFPFRLLLAQEPPEARPLYEVRFCFASLRCAGSCFPKETFASRPKACAAGSYKTGLALQVSQWTF